MIPALASLRSRNFRIFFAGQFVSIVGTWLQTLALSWMVYRLTGSALMLGITAAAQQLPMLLVSPLAGVWTDRADQRRMLVIAQALSAVQAALLAGLVFSGHVQPNYLIAASFFLGLINAFETPTRQAFLLKLVGSREALPNAIALQSMMFNGARFVGPSLAGLVLAAFGEAWCFVLNACSYLVILAAYLRIRVAPYRPGPAQARWWQALASGMRYAFGFVATQRILLLLGALSFFTAPWQTLMPILARETFRGGSDTFGFLIGAVGAGAFAGTAFLAVRANASGLGRIICVSSLVAGVTLTLFSFSHALSVALCLLGLFGFGLIVSVAAANTILQTVAADNMRGRVISLYVMTFLGIAPLGNFTAGALAERIGVHATLSLCGIAVTAAAVLFTLGFPRWNKAVRDAYLRTRSPV